MGTMGMMRTSAALFALTCASAAWAQQTPAETGPRPQDMAPREPRPADTQAPTPAPDRDWVGAWLILPMSVTACQATSQMADQATFVSYIEFEKEAPRLALLNDRWRLSKGQAFPATLSWDGWQTTVPLSFSADQTPSGRSVLGAAMPVGFRPGVLGSGRFAVRIPALGLDTQIGFPQGATPMFDALTRCNAQN